MSEEKYSPDEVIRIAVKGEEIAEKFYGYLLAHSSDERLKQLAQQLLDDERRHRKVFENMLASLEDNFMTDCPQGNVDAYIGALARESVFSPGCAESAVCADLTGWREVLDYGICMKKDALLFYTGLKGRLTDRQEVIDEIIKEETQHFVELSDLKKSYEKEGS